MSRPSEAVAAHLAQQQPARSQDSLAQLQAKAAEARDLELEILELETRLKEKAEALRELYHKAMPDLLLQLKMDHIGCPPDDNKPGIDYHLKSYYSANIAASWEADRRQEGFEFLKARHAEELIKTKVAANFGKGQFKLAKALVAAAKKLQIQTETNLSVHPGTLTAWLKEQYEKRGANFTPEELAKIGGSVGVVVKPEIRKT